jgi:HSP20 family protein
MATFMEKLKKKDIDLASSTSGQSAAPAVAEPGAKSNKEIDGAFQLRVDIFQTSVAVLVYAQLAGAGVDDFSVSVEGDGDVVTIKGQRVRPNGDVFHIPEEKGQAEHKLEECEWGRFYRQIILPSEVDSSQAQAKLKNGVLVLLLPLKKPVSNSIKVNVVEA